MELSCCTSVLSVLPVYLSADIAFPTMHQPRTDSWAHAIADVMVLIGASAVAQLLSLSSPNIQFCN